MPAKFYDLVDTTKKYKGDLHSFYLSMKSWRKFKSKYKLDWHKARFEPSVHATIPTVRGMYVFTLELSPGKLPMHGYILYVGITGNTSAATLHTRYGQYLLHLKNKDGRPAVRYMLENWRDDLFFNFVPLSDLKIDLAKIEKAFINAVMPPVNKRDFEATIAAPKAAAF